ncbi:MAG: A/G-specific adenine glycosylase [Gallionella sp.]
MRSAKASNAIDVSGVSNFASRLIAWHRHHGRHDLPWQTGDAYHVWLSEIMLQQTQVATVIPYFQRFIASFPNISDLASSSVEQVLEHWSGLGYYARGRNLHASAQIIAKQFLGRFPCSYDQILELPGVGRSTAAAICALAFHQRRAILDGNVKRVLARYCGIAGWAGDSRVEHRLWEQAESLLPHHDIASYIQAQMDLGATLCTRSKPKCDACPLQPDCVACQSGRITEYPSPRPRKTVPQKRSTFLIVMHGDTILLEKRAPHGIWGGLWCFPQLDNASDDVTDYLQHHGLGAAVQLPLTPFAHTFTHFKLHICPILLRVEHGPLAIQEAGSVWLDVRQALKAAIPVPVRKILQELQMKSS